MNQAIPTNIQALVAIAVIAVVTPYVTTLVTKPGAPAWITGPVSGLVTGAGAVAAYLFGVQGVPDWTHVFGLFVVAVAATQGFRKGLEPGLEPKVAAVTAKVGIGGATGAKTADDGASTQAVADAFAQHADRPAPVPTPVA